MASFRPAGRTLVFRAPSVPAEAYGPVVAFLSDKLHWLALWHDPAADAAGNDAVSPMQICFSPAFEFAKAIA